MPKFPIPPLLILLPTLLPTLLLALLLPLNLLADETRLERLRAQISGQQMELGQLQGHFAALDEEKLRLDALLQDWLARLERHLHADLPYHSKERLTRLQELKQQLADPELVYAERLRRLLQAFLDEVEAGQNLEAWDAELEEAGVQPPRLVTFLRYGRLTLAYQTFDGTQSGYWDRQTRRWQPLPEGLDAEIKRGIQVALKRIPPDLLIMPLAAGSQLESDNADVVRPPAPPVPSRTAGAQASDAQSPQTVATEPPSDRIGAGQLPQTLASGTQDPALASKTPEQIKQEQLEQEKLLLKQLQADAQVLTQAISSGRERLTQAKAALGDLGSALWLLAEDSSKLLAGSLIRLQHPQAGIDLEAMRQISQDYRAQVQANAQVNIGPADSSALRQQLQQLAQRLQLEFEGQGQLASFSSLLVAGDGQQSQAEVLRVGPFVALHQGRYLEFVPELQRLRLLDRQPTSRFLLANGQTQGAVTTYAIDPSRGALLSLLVQTPALEERLHQGGLVGYLILLLAAVGLVIALWRILGLRLVSARVSWQKRHSTEPRPNNPLGRVLLAVQDQTERDIELIERRLDEAILKEMPRLERGLPLIRLLAAIAPLLGLLGTVVGMILTFQAISLFGSGDPKLMAGGISQALVTTVMGLCAAIPLLLLHSMAAGSSRKVEQILEEQSAALVARRLEQH
jgi:biopolymer transport protein ExbB